MSRMGLFYFYVLSEGALSKPNPIYWLQESATADVFWPICLSNGLPKAERLVRSRCGVYYRKCGFPFLELGFPRLKDSSPPPLFLITIRTIYLTHFIYDPPIPIRATLFMFVAIYASRYLQNGNILAARTFLNQFVSQATSKNPGLISSVQTTPIPVGKPQGDRTDEIIVATDSILNWAQLAVRTCQRAQGDKNKAMREAWVRLCGTYQSRGGLLARPEVRKVSVVF